MIRGRKINLRTIKEQDLDTLIYFKNKFEEKGDFWPVDLCSEINFKHKFKENGLLDDNSGTMVITDKNENIVGTISYFPGIWYLTGYEIGYEIYRQGDRGNGYMTEALTLFSAYLFDIKPIKRLEIEISKGNYASRRVVEKCGYQHEGTKRKAVFCKGLYNDLEIFSLLKEECLGLKETIEKLNLL
ncbi:GNAT family N-acetyltransferase [Clostridium frigidicarnis]|uniref:Protein N-acetyltransferase, RimJ/RimL family n=1 Tax=Clostridium frigidicarnis TaxID=84698 RepID=A0A1I0YIR5_9CLOT|nr:GNAT family protein [Clostridium frigidicarnis]SFB13259.1 Protein N-acetyltransferase, RimJ/RimL family [Clostridium frigidicarnis]